jgi:5'-phosphate synthase pdxT subunit
MTIGVLALQGCIEPHSAMIQKIGLSARQVKSIEDLSEIDRLIMPGGESTTMLKLLTRTNLDSAITEFAKHHPVWGVCAGAILIAREVIHPSQKSLGLIDIQAVRNYYGPQTESFRAQVHFDEPEMDTSVDFIRAPLLKPLSPKVKVLACLNDQPILLRQGNILVSSFHIELGDDTRLHRYFAGL